MTLYVAQVRQQQKMPHSFHVKPHGAIWVDASTQTQTQQVDTFGFQSELGLSLFFFINLKPLKK